MSWAPELVNLVLGGLPKVAWEAIPEKTKRQVLERVRSLDPWRSTSRNHDLTRALRLAWIEAAEGVLSQAELLDQLPEYRAKRDETAAFSAVLRKEMWKVKDVALDRESKERLPPSIIDTHLDEILQGTPLSLVGDEETAYSRHLTENFAAVVAEIAGWPRAEVPTLVLHVAATGSRSFGRLVFDAFARLMKEPVAYPQAREAFRIIQQAAVDAVAREIRDLVRGVDAKLDQLLAAPDLTSIVVVGAERHTALLESVSRQLEGVQGGIGTIVETLGHHTEMLRDLGLARSTAQAFVLGSRFPEARPGTVFILTEEAKRDRYNQIEHDLLRATARLLPETVIAPYFWPADAAQRLLERDSGLVVEVTRQWRSREHLATIWLAGNGIGAPLDTTPDIARVVSSAGLLAGRRPGVKLDWPLSPAERDAAAALGHFPLTLVMLAFAEARIAGKPFWICRDTAKPDGVVERFVEFAAGLGATVVEAGAAASGAWIDRFIRLLFDLGAADTENPYRFLDFYDVTDADVFCGRDAEGARFAQLVEASRTAGPPLCIAVTGASGSGKSSFLRAKALPQLAEAQIRSAIVRPTDFHDGEGKPTGVVATLLEAIARQADIEIDRTVVQTIARMPSANAVRPSANVLTCALARGGKPAMALCLAFDQFEEVVDDLGDGFHSAEWTALVALADALLETGLVGVVFTVEDARLPKLQSVLAQSRLAGAGQLALATDAEAFLTEVVTRPFVGNGIALAPEIVARLVAEARKVELTRSARDGISGSILPLLSLKLSLLHERIATSGEVPRRVEMEELADYDFALEAEIDALAEQAWRAGSADERDRVELHEFLRPLVRVSIADTASTNGLTVVLGTVAVRRSGARLDDAFRRHRLLVPTANGLRLAHEAVLRRWSRARRWLREEEEDLRIEARLRLEAKLWDLRRRPELPGADARTIDDAAWLLNQMRNISGWARGSEPTSADDEAFRHYCTALFSGTETPLRVVRMSPSGMLHIHLAVALGLTDVVMRLLEADPAAGDVPTTERKLTPLHVAAWYGHAELVAYLIEKGASPDKVDAYGQIAIGYAAAADDEQTAALLLRYTTEETMRLPEVQNPLNACAATDNVAMARMFEQAGCNPLRGWNGCLPLHIAAESGKLRTFRHFLAKSDPAAVTDDGWSALHIAASRGHLAIVRELLQVPQAVILVDARTTAGLTPLMVAARNSHSEIVRLLAPFSDVQARVPSGEGHAGATALHFALLPLQGAEIKASSETATVARTVEVLIEAAGVNVGHATEEGITAYAMAANHPSIRHLLRRHPTFEASQPDREGRTPLMHAIDDRDFKVVARLLALAHLDLDHVSDAGDTALGKLIQVGWIEQAQDLIASGRCDPWAGGSRSKGALSVALDEGRIELADRILAMVPPKPHPRQIGEALRAAMARDMDIEWAARIIGKAGAPLHETLFLAYRFSRRDVAQLLVEAGADPQSRDAWGRRPVDLSPDAPSLRPDGALAEPLGSAKYLADMPGWRPIDDEAILAPFGAPRDAFAAALEMDLSFYPTARLIMLEPRASSGEYYYFLFGRGGLTRLNGTSPPIHQFNAYHPICLTEQTCLQYLSFFCFFVRGEGGPWLTMGDGGLETWLEYAVVGRHSDRLPVIRRCAHRPRFYGTNDNGCFRLSTFLVYADHAFTGDFLIRPDGMIEMADDEPLASLKGAEVRYGSVTGTALEPQQVEGEPPTPPAAEREAAAAEGTVTLFDRINDFKPEEGDVIDLSAIIARPTRAESDVAAWVRAVPGEGGTMLQVNNHDGSGWRDAMFLDGYASIDVIAWHRAGILDVS